MKNKKLWFGGKHLKHYKASLIDLFTQVQEELIRQGFEWNWSHADDFHKEDVEANPKRILQPVLGYDFWLQLWFEGHSGLETPVMELCYGKENYVRQKDLEAISCDDIGVFQSGDLVVAKQGSRDVYYVEDCSVFGMIELSRKGSVWGYFPSGSFVKAVVDPKKSIYREMLKDQDNEMKEREERYSKNKNIRADDSGLSTGEILLNLRKHKE